MMKKKTTRKNLSENRNNTNSIGCDDYCTFNSCDDYCTFNISGNNNKLGV